MTPMTANPEDVRKRNSTSVMRAARAAQARVRRDRPDGWYLRLEGAQTMLDRPSTEAFFALAEDELLDLLIFAALARERVRDLRAQITDEGVWAHRLFAKPRPNTARCPAVGEHVQFVGANRYVDVERVSAYVFELRMGKVEADGNYAGNQRRRLQGWAQCRRSIADWMAGGAGSPKVQS